VTWAALKVDARLDSRDALRGMDAGTVARLYEYVRNPMYVGVVTALFGQSALFESRAILAYAIAIAILFHTWIVIYEEPRLAQSFGSSYDEYRARVPRWIPSRPRR